MSPNIQEILANQKQIDIDIAAFRQHVRDENKRARRIHYAFLIAVTIAAVLGLLVSYLTQ